MDAPVGGVLAAGHVAFTSMGESVRMAATRHRLPAADHSPSEARPTYLTTGRPVVLAHRGFAPDGGENSMAAFDAAVALGCEYVETDVHTTTDGVVVAFHDESLERVTDSAGLVDDLPWEVVRAARITGGHPIPTLAELLQRHPTLRVNIDLKSDTAVEPTVAVIERLGAHDRVLVTSFDDRRRRRALTLLSRPVATSAGGSTAMRAVASVWPYITTSSAPRDSRRRARTRTFSGARRPPACAMKAPRRAYSPPKTRPFVVPEVSLAATSASWSQVVGKSASVSPAAVHRFSLMTSCSVEKSFGAQ